MIRTQQWGEYIFILDNTKRHNFCACHHYEDVRTNYVLKQKKSLRLSFISLNFEKSSRA